MESARVLEVRALTTLVAVLAAYVIPGSHSWSRPVLPRPRLLALSPDC